MDGIRSQKLVNGVIHSYVTQNGKVVRESFPYGDTTIIMDFIYDEAGRPFCVAYSKDGGANYTAYFYAVNAQGDVEGLFRVIKNADTGKYEQKWYGRYTYDAWGNVTATTAAGNTPSATSLVVRNPIRYRGYVYDNETGFYYLQSRYYDPANHRFISADTAEYSAMSAYSLNDTNLFTYCGNNPVSRADDGGEFWNFVVGAIVGAVVGAVSTAVESVRENGWEALSQGSTWAKIGISSVCGSINGLVAASGVGAFAAGAVGAATGFVESLGHELIDGKGKLNAESWANIGIDTAVGFVGGLAGGKGAINNNKYMLRQVTRLKKHLAVDGLKKAGTFYYKMTATYSKQFIMPTLKGIAKSTIGAKVSNKLIEMVRNKKDQADSSVMQEALA